MLLFETIGRNNCNNQFCDTLNSFRNMQIQFVRKFFFILILIGFSKLDSVLFSRSIFTIRLAILLDQFAYLVLYMHGIFDFSHNLNQFLLRKRSTKKTNVKFYPFILYGWWLKTPIQNVNQTTSENLANWNEHLWNLNAAVALASS